MKMNEQIMKAVKETMDFQVDLNNDIELNKNDILKNALDTEENKIILSMHQQISDILDELSNMDIYTYDTICENDKEREEYRNKYVETFSNFKKAISSGYKFSITKDDENVRTYNTDTDVTIYSNSFFDILNTIDTVYTIFGEKSGTAFCEGIDFSWLDASHIMRFSVDILKGLSIDTNEKSLLIISDIMKLTGVTYKFLLDTILTLSDKE